MLTIYLSWVQGQGAGPRLKGDDDDEEEKFDAMGNKIVSTKKAKKLTSAELRKKKKDRMARRKRGEVCESLQILLERDANKHARRFSVMKTIRCGVDQKELFPLLWRAYGLVLIDVYYEQYFCD